MTAAVPTTRDRILDAAVELLASHGLKRLAQPQVAKAAGVPQGHLTYYFPKRADLLGAVAHRYAEQVLEQLRRFLEARGQDAPLDLDAMLAFASEVMGDRQRTRMLLGLLVESEDDPALRELLVQNAALVRAAVGQMLGGRDADDPLILVLQSALWGLGVQHLLLGERRKPEEFRRLVDQLGAVFGPLVETRPPARPARRRITPKERS